MGTRKHPDDLIKLGIDFCIEHQRWPVASDFGRSSTFITNFGSWSRYLERLEQAWSQEFADVPWRHQPLDPVRSTGPQQEPPPTSEKSTTVSDTSTRTHLFIPDAQCRPGSKRDHIRALSKLIATERPEVIVIAGDWGDFESLSSYDSATHKQKIGVSVEADMQVFNDALADLCREWSSDPAYHPELHFLWGNHDGPDAGGRRGRYANDHPELADTVADARLNLYRFTTHQFRRPVHIDGVAYCHLFCVNKDGLTTQHTTKFGQASATAQIANYGMSSTAGHKQGFRYAIKESKPHRLHGLIAGSFYMDEFDYLTPQGHDHWQGVILKHDVHDGEYDLEQVSIPRLLRKYG